MLLLIDGSHAVFRSFFAVRSLSSPSGMPTGAVFGFVNMLLKLVRDREPARVGVCFDTSAPTHRHKLDDRYKANRPEMPPELQVQWPICQDVVAELGLPMLKLDGLEADDLIATLAEQGRAQGYEVVIVSGDKDLMQLVDDGSDERPPIRQLDDGKERLYDMAGVGEKWGVPPSQVRDLLAIMGDSSDNIAGVKGLGEKGAAKLLQAWGSLEAIYANLERVEPLRARELLRADRVQAMRAYELVGLVHDAQLPWQVGDLAPIPPDRAALAKRFATLGFKRLTAEYSQAPAAVQVAPVEAAKVIESQAELVAVLDKVRKAKQLALWACTDRADLDRTRPLYGHLVGLALAWSPDEAAYLPIGHAKDLEGATALPQVMWHALLEPVLADPTIAKYGCGIKFELLALQTAGLNLAGVTGDAMLASYLDEAEKHSHNLRNIAYTVLGETVPLDEDLLGKGKAQTGWDRVPVQAAATQLCHKARLALRLCRWYPAQLKEVAVFALYRDLELPLAGVLARMESNGIALDCDELARQSVWLGEQAHSAEAEVWQAAGRQFNVGSPQQLGEVLFDEMKLPAKKRTQTGYSTDQSVLEGLEDDHPIAKSVLRWRQLTKLKSTYADQLPEMVLPATGRVHTWYGQAVAATGRLSSIDPNLQNIPVRSPEGRAIRKAFVAAPGNVLLSADYSQIELRVMAHLANDPGLQLAFQRGLDIHRETAARMFNMLPLMVTGEQRSAAKTINFGILYGMGPQRLSREIGVTLKEAKSFIDRYFEGFPAVKAWMEQTLVQARLSGEVRTLFGRRRVIPGLTSQAPQDRAQAERIAINTPVQGTAADLIKWAMLQVDKRLQGQQAKMLLQVHDELVVEVPEAQAAQVAEVVREAMQGAGKLPDGTMMKVPLAVDVRWAGCWADAH